MLLCLLPRVANAADVSGTCEINKKKFKLTHGYIDMVQPEEPVIVLSDKPLPEEQIPFLMRIMRSRTRSMQLSLA